MLITDQLPQAVGRSYKASPRGPVYAFTAMAIECILAACLIS
jgi:hypothetical protein